MKYIFILLAALLLISCKTPQVITERYERDSVIVREVTKLVEVPGASISSPIINIDSLAALLKAQVPVSTINKTLIREDPETGLKVGILIDQLGNLTAVCEQQERIIEVQQQEIERLKLITTRETITHKPSFIEHAKQVLIIAFALVILVLLFRFFTKT
jgi:Ni/Fe-hydrogenase subunit HybB-like protein